MSHTFKFFISFVPKYGSLFLLRNFEQKSKIEKGDAYTSPFSIMPKIQGKKISR